MVKRKGSKFSKDEERVSKRRLRSGRIIETLTPLRLTKEVVTVRAASTPSNLKVKLLTSSKSAIKIARVIDSEDGLDDETELSSTSSRDPQVIVVQKKALSDDTNMNQAKSAGKTARGIVTTPYLPLFEANAICR